MDLDKFASEKFNGDDYVKHLVKEMVAGSELSEFRKQLTTEKEGVSNLLKKKVFENYSQFIETAREISRKLHLSLIKATIPLCHNNISISAHKIVHCIF